MNLEKIISNLLYAHDCVIVPGFGAFLTHKKPATLEGNSLCPPSKQLGFNSVLEKSDGLLIQAVAQQNNLGFQEAQREVENIIIFWKNHLEKNKSLILEELGTFTKNQSGSLEFNSNGKNYLLDSFGLESIRTKYIMQSIPESRNSSAVWWKVASVIPVLVGGYLYFAQPKPVADFVNEQWSGFVTPLINSQNTPEETPIIITETIELPVVETNKPEQITHDYQVIAGAFRLLDEAKSLEQKLQEQGFENAKFTQKKGNYFFVAFETFPTKEEALEYRKTVRDAFPETWVLSLKED